MQSALDDDVFARGVGEYGDGNAVIAGKDEKELREYCIVGFHALLMCSRSIS